ncbi:MAG: DNA polymerase III subunit beta [Gammaproteobacteria bacterium RIFCSPLOWO2_02_FULL_38_11]|nr:MAG: DNA polymerase III subunit beta [Gammaproteobacteria bacterium RIFCSPHIGHO2_02_FULL_38_33]OGT24266.1 MAG: DNA polymerase III subunit beta [Gammaproteobacteria bacterium RIFCSPHIGHO2_12_38_15]OGT68365.1 MAG: DNA polymerase III subunit beta [Gammaproteobacteria bacterium RIFCSPLOWO2_02_FULL_38_11]OGT77270.1 MAG: DNA polymerase III subunit beta [Gammaproteobacteria bacterium RIFCSPLOWO2_12_FULL_38_14]
MKFKINRDVLLKPLTFVVGAIEKRNTLPILSHVLITIENQQCTLIGTDLEVELNCRFTLDEPASEGSLTVPASKLLDICKTLPEHSKIEFSKENQLLKIRSDQAKFTLPTLSAAEFPHIEIQKSYCEINIPGQIFQKLFKQTHFAMALQDVRYFLNGAYLEINSEGVRVIATDGHRLALSESVSLPENQNKTKAQCIIPRKSVLEIIRLFQESEETLTLHFSDHFLKITSLNCGLITKLIDGRYPNYRKVMPKISEKFFIADKTQFQQALNCIAVVTSEKFSGARLQIQKEAMNLQARNPEQEEAEQIFPIQQPLPEPHELAINFNVNYLLDALSAIHDHQIKVFFSDAETGFIFEGAETPLGRYLIMPLRL